MLSSFVSAVALLGAVATALDPPSSDPFYVAPANIASLAPGTVVAYRAPPASLNGLLGTPFTYGSAYQISYATTNVFKKAELAVLTLIKPASNADPTKLLSYQMAEDSAYINCAPSYGMQAGSAPDSAAYPQLELSFVQMALNNGWFVVVPDYEGPSATFLANTAAGQRVLDGIRAVFNAPISGVSKSASVAMWGYSGGSLASGFAAEVAPHYAPEINIVGAALGGTVPNILQVLYTVNNGPFAGLIPPGILGLMQAYPKLAKYVSKVLIPSKAADFNKAKTLCLLGSIATYANQNVFSYTTTPDAFTAKLPTKIEQANMQGNGTPKTPLYIYKGALDEVSPINDTQLLVKTYCSKGVSVDFVTYPFAGHLDLTAAGASAAVTWLQARLGGTPQTGCTSSSD